MQMTKSQNTLTNPGESPSDAHHSPYPMLN